MDTTAEKGWSAISNGELLELTESESYHQMITTDQDLRYQQNLSGKKLGILVLKGTSWPKIQTRIPEILAAIPAAADGG